MSVFAGVNHVQKAKVWEALGADCITLESLSVNRCFQLLASFREHVRCDLKLLLNTNRRRRRSGSPPSIPRRSRGRELANLCPLTIAALRTPLRTGFARVRRQPQLAFACRHHAGLKL